MLPITKKRVRLSIDEKLWILNHGKENPKITQSKIPLDFSAEFKNSVPHTVCGIPQFFFREILLTKIVTFSLGQKGFYYFGKCHYLGCHYYEWAQ